MRLSIKDTKQMSNRNFAAYFFAVWVIESAGNYDNDRISHNKADQYGIIFW